MAAASPGSTSPSSRMICSHTSFSLVTSGAHSTVVKARLSFTWIMAASRPPSTSMEAAFSRSWAISSTPRPVCISLRAAAGVMDASGGILFIFAASWVISCKTPRKSTSLPGSGAVPWAGRMACTCSCAVIRPINSLRSGENSTSTASMPSSAM